jgi:prophage antirepressor-like protein
MSDLQLFQFNNNKVQIFVINQQPYFVSQDVAKILEYADIGNMLSHVDDDDNMKNGL